MPRPRPDQPKGGADVEFGTLNCSAEMCKHLKLFATALQCNLGAKIKRLQKDGGPEFKLYVDRYLKDEEIQHRITPPNHLDQNGIAERANRRIMG